MIQLDSIGNPATPVASLQAAIPLELGTSVSGSGSGPSLGLWGETNGGQASFLAFLYLSPAPSPWIATASDSTDNRSASSVPVRATLKVGDKQIYNGEQLVVPGHAPIPHAYGYLRIGTYTALNSKGKPVKNPTSMIATEDIVPVSSNPPNGTTITGQGALNELSQYQDYLGFIFQLPPPPQPGEYVKARQTINIKTKAQNYPRIRVNCVDQEYNDETFTDVTENPNATCQ